MKEEVLNALQWELKEHPFFSALDEERLAELLALGESVVFAARKTIFAQGDTSDCLYIILSGRVKINLLSQAGKETVLAFIGKGEVIGEMGVFDGGPRSAGAVTLEQVRALRLRQVDVVSFLTANPTVSLKVIAALSARIRHTNLLLEDIATLPVPSRLANSLLRLTELYGVPKPDGSVLIDIKISQSNLGAHAGIMRENVNRQLKAWQSEGLLLSDAGVFTITDIEKMRELATQPS